MSLSGVVSSIFSRGCTFCHSSGWKCKRGQAARGDGHSLTAEDAANSSGDGGSDLWEGAEDGSGQGHHHGRGLDDNGGGLALPDTGLIAAAGQRSRATGLAWHALITARHVWGLLLYLGEGARRKNMKTQEEQIINTESQGTCMAGSRQLKTFGLILPQPRRNHQELYNCSLDRST